MNQIRVLIADDHHLVREGLINLLDKEESIFVVSEAASGKELIERYFESKPDVIVVDINMPRITGLEAVKKIKNKDENVKALFLTMHTEEEYIYYALKSGGMGLLNKGVLSGELIYAIRTVAEGNRYFLNKSDEDINIIIKKYDVMNKQSELPDLNFLTSREKEVLKYIAEGLTSEEIAEKLFVSKRTVDTYRSNIMDKLNIRSLPKLIKYAIEFNYFPKEE
jgi:two-component system response regulator NreC